MLWRNWAYQMCVELHTSSCEHDEISGCHSDKYEYGCLWDVVACILLDFV